MRSPGITGAIDAVDFSDILEYVYVEDILNKAGI
jgi:hypothetical protein